MNLDELLEQRVAAAPDKRFLLSEADGRQFTYAQFRAAVNRAANMLLAHGVRKGDAVALLMPNSAEYVIAYFACWQLGAVAGPINSLLKTQELAFVLQNSEARALLLHPDYEANIETIRTQLPSLQSVISFADEAVATKGFSADPEKQQEIVSDDEAIIIYTSGTTGKPKGCLLTHGNVIANACQISEWLSFTESDRLLSSIPLFHMNAVSVTTMAAL